MPALFQLFLAGIGGGGFVVLLLRTFFIEKIRASIKSDYDSKLESLRNDLSRQQTALSSSINSQIQAFHAVNNYRVDALLQYWTDFSRVSRLTMNANSSDRFLLDDEIDEVLNGRVIKLDPNDWVGMKHDPGKVAQAIDEGATDVGKLRPLIGEQLWYYHLTLRLFSGRISLLYSHSHLTTKWQHWKKDEALLRVLRQALSNEEADRITQLNNGSINAVCHILEQKVLGTIAQILSGEIASSNTLDNARRLNDLMNAAQAK